MSRNSITASLPRALFAVLLLCLPGYAQQFGRPRAEEGPTVIHMVVMALDIDEINSADQNFTMNLFFRARWQDDRLKHPGPGPLVMGMDEAWAPDFQFTNQQKLFKTFADRLIVSPSGEVLYRQRVWGPFSQKLDLTEFPFDVQSFEAQMVAADPESEAEDIEMIQDVQFPSGLAPGFSLPDWDVLSWEAIPQNYQPFEKAPATPGFAFEFVAKRHVGYYLIKIMLPLLLIVMMSWIVFWIDPKEMGTQISVSVTSMLTLIAYRFMVGSALPTISYLTRMDMFILCSTLLVFATLLEAVCTGILARNERVELARRIDRFARVIFPGGLVVVVLLTLVF